MIQRYGVCMMAVSVVVASALSCTRQGADKAPRGADVPLKEASTAFDLGQVGPFLDRVTTMVDSGFGPAERDSVVQMLEAMKVDQESTREFAITYLGQPTVLRVRVFLDDVDAPDVAIITRPDLADKIQREMAQFMNEQGM